MRKKQTLLIIATIMCALIISSSIALAASGQQVKIPYVVSMDDAGWWTAFAITNNSGDPITDMTLYFTTSAGASGFTLPVLDDPFDPPKLAIPGIFINYSTVLDEIAGNAILINTLPALYTGDGTKTLPSDAGSVILAHTGDEPFSVTVYIGSPTGFAFNVKNSESP